MIRLHGLLPQRRSDSILTIYTNKNWSEKHTGAYYNLELLLGMLLRRRVASNWAAVQSHDLEALKGVGGCRCNNGGVTTCSIFPQ